MARESVSDPSHPRGDASRPEPWWLSGGTERCGICLQLYAYEVEVRCVACDGPSCPHCAMWTRQSRTVVCRPCSEHG